MLLFLSVCLLTDEHKMRGVEKDKYISGEEAEEDSHGGTEKSALLGVGQHTNESGSNGKILSIHSSESQQEFFRMLDEKIEKHRRVDIPDFVSACRTDGREKIGVSVHGSSALPL
ncbi:hypothetical protein AMECASPLE_035768 [Ameca splendens]|uniref:Uncharacterized protein n=1 Tax=Ameca splendens TaxID=208324 RepID=A0ABV0ZG76_9TELE